jgi:hypothetical protein
MKDHNFHIRRTDDECRTLVERLGVSAGGQTGSDPITDPVQAEYFRRGVESTLNWLGDKNGRVPLEYIEPTASQR